MIEEGEPIFDHLLSRCHCSKNRRVKKMVKDLKVLLDGRRIEDIIIVDNRIENFAIHFTNGLPILDFRGDSKDNQLALLENYLMRFLWVPDVRVKIKKDFKLTNLLK